MLDSKDKEHITPFGDIKIEFLKAANRVTQEKRF
jgi:hypothetical protein